MFFLGFLPLLLLNKKTDFLYVYQICITLGAVLAIVAPIGGLRVIIHQAQTYKFYSLAPEDQDNKICIHV